MEAIEDEYNTQMDGAAKEAATAMVIATPVQSMPGPKAFRDQTAHCMPGTERDAQGRRRTISSAHSLKQAAAQSKAARAKAKDQVYVDAAGELSEQAAGISHDPSTGKPLTPSRAVHARVTEIEAPGDLPQTISPTVEWPAPALTAASVFGDMPASASA